MSLSVGLSLNHGGLTYMDVAESKFRVSYRLNRNIFSFLKNSKWEIFLQLSEMHRFDNEAISRSLNTALRMQEPSRSNFVGRQIYVSPGISISNSNLIFEGMVKVPINAREANRTLDDLWSPEVQGNLGLKYLFPVRSSR
ncbi:signal peptide [Leptospira ryugenii]|uniref:Signal peptide n=2 Tax=Leptospira ryugenii TaxID=1917863 RepID=A0A2P2E534_9LEPT|nr:signal peptide [Leptospira ryugenii]